MISGNPKEEVGKSINYLMIARDRYIDEGNDLLVRFMKLRKKLHASGKGMR